MAHSRREIQMLYDIFLRMDYYNELVRLLKDFHRFDRYNPSIRQLEKRNILYSMNSKVDTDQPIKK